MNDYEEIYQYENLYQTHKKARKGKQALPYHHRVVQHSLCDNTLAPFFEKRLIYDNAACRQGKGPHFAMERLTGFLRQHYARYGTSGYSSVIHTLYG